MLMMFWLGDRSSNPFSHTMNPAPDIHSLICQVWMSGDKIVQIDFVIMLSLPVLFKMRLHIHIHNIILFPEDAPERRAALIHKACTNTHMNSVAPSTFVCIFVYPLFVWKAEVSHFSEFGYKPLRECHNIRGKWLKFIIRIFLPYCIILFLVYHGWLLKKNAPRNGGPRMSKQRRLRHCHKRKLRNYACVHLSLLGALKRLKWLLYPFERRCILVPLT